MHRKDYELIAKCLRKVKDEAEKAGIFSTETMNKIISEFCLKLKEENSSFNEQKFRDYIEKGE